MAGQAIQEAPPKLAFAPTTEFEKASRKKRKMTLGLSLGDVKKKLEDEVKRSKDLLVPYKDLRAKLRSNAGGTEHSMMISVKGHGEYRVFEPVIDQICNHTSVKDVRTLPAAYLRKMLEHGDNREIVSLAVDNVNRWMELRSGEFHKTRKGANVKDGEKRVMLRMLADDDGEYIVRAMLSDRYLVLSNAQLLTAILVTLSGKDGKQGDIVDSMVRGAVMFDWSHSPFELNLGVVNPGFSFNLRDPDKGVVEAEQVKLDGGNGHGFLYPGAKKPYRPGTNYTPEDSGGGHWVMPAAFLSNSETGGGAASVAMSLLEAACENTALIEAFTRRHTGARVTTLEDYESDTTRQKQLELICSQFTDALRQVFDRKEFEANCRRMLGLFDLRVSNVEEAAKWALQQAQALDLLTDLLKVYEPFNHGKDSVGDIQRALTNVAQDQSADKADRLMVFAGNLLSGDVKLDNKLLVKA